MAKIKLSLILTALVFLCFSCGQDTSSEDISPPEAPIWCEKSVEYAEIETGIDAVPQGNWIYLEWEPNTDEDLAGYQVWRMAEDDTTETFQLLQILTLTQLTNPNQPNFTDMSSEVAPDPSTGFERGYYYSLNAFDDLGNQSSFSDTIYYELLRKPQSLSIDAGLDTVRWSYPVLPEQDVYFVIRIVRAFSGDYVWLAKYYVYQEPFAVLYNFDEGAGLMGIGEYYMRIDVSYMNTVDELYNGAESNLYYFTIQ